MGSIIWSFSIRQIIITFILLLLFSFTWRKSITLENDESYRRKMHEALRWSRGDFKGFWRFKWQRAGSNKGRRWYQISLWSVLLALTMCHRQMARCVSMQRGDHLAYNTPDWEKNREKLSFPTYRTCNLGMNGWTALIHLSNGWREGMFFKPPEQFYLQGSVIIR